MEFTEDQWYQSIKADPKMQIQLRKYIKNYKKEFVAMSNPSRKDHRVSNKQNGSQNYQTHREKERNSREKISNSQEKRFTHKDIQSSLQLFRSLHVKPSDMNRHISTAQNGVEAHCYQTQRPTSIDKPTDTAFIDSSSESAKNVTDQSLFTDPQILKECKLFLQKTQEKIKSNQLIHQLSQTQKGTFEQAFQGIYAQEVFDFLITTEVRNKTKIPSSYFDNYLKFRHQLSAFFSHQGRALLGKEEFGMGEPIIFPFQSEFDLITFEKLVAFLEHYCKPKPNEIRIIFNKIDTSRSGRIRSGNCRENPMVFEKLQAFVGMWGKWGESLSYWEFYWAKSSEEGQEFIKAYQSDRL